VESNVRYWRKQKELLKNSKSDSRAFRGPKAGKSAYFTHSDFSAAKLKKSVQIMQVNTVSFHPRHNSILSAIRTQHCSGDQIEKNEMGGACSTYG
jgi:hypothetical protein